MNKISTFEAARRFDELNHKSVLEAIVSRDAGMGLLVHMLNEMDAPFAAAEDVSAFGVEVREWIKVGNVVRAYKVVRDYSGISLKEAKDVVDTVRGHLQTSYPVVLNEKQIALVKLIGIVEPDQIIPNLQRQIMQQAEQHKGEMDRLRDTLNNERIGHARAADRESAARARLVAAADELKKALRLNTHLVLDSLMDMGIATWTPDSEIQMGIDRARHLAGFDRNERDV